MSTRVFRFENSGKLLTNAAVAILLIVGSLAAHAEEDARQNLDGAINCGSGANEGSNPYCAANKQFKETFPKANRLILDFIKPRVLDADLHEDSPVFDGFYDIYKTDAYPIYLIHFEHQMYQDLTFERVASYIDQKDQLSYFYEYKIGDDGCSFAIAEIAGFFTYMESKGLPLNAMEDRLKQALLDARILNRNGQGSYEAGTSAIIAINRESSKGTLSHELNHAVYFTDATYRQNVEKFWMTLNDENKHLVQQTLKIISDGTLNIERDRYLFLTEFAAYFRDSETLLREYLDEEKNASDILRQISSIESGLRGIERHTPFYQSLHDIPSAQTAR